LRLFTDSRLRNGADHPMKRRFAEALLVERDLPFDGSKRQPSTPSPLFDGRKTDCISMDPSSQMTEACGIGGAW
jgi:hypothetical protein